MSPAPPRRPPDDAEPPIDKVKRDDEKAPEQFKSKEFEKVKADKEQPEKLKPEKEQPEKLKPEKEVKAEGKEFEKASKEIEKASKELEKVKSDKEFEKVKADKEQPEKLKPEKEQPEKLKPEKEQPEKLKPEKEHKGEFKEFEKVKSDKEFEKFKSDKEFVREKQFPEKTDKEVAEGRPIDEVINPAAALDPAALLAHADSLEQAGRQLRHFIERSMRPDLSTGALQNEADLADESAPEQDDG